MSKITVLTGDCLMGIGFRMYLHRSNVEIVIARVQSSPYITNTEHGFKIHESAVSL